MTVYRVPDKETQLDFFRSVAASDGPLSANSMFSRALDDRFNAALCRLEAHWLDVMVEHQVSTMTVGDDEVRVHIGILATKAERLDKSAESLIRRASGERHS